MISIILICLITNLLKPAIGYTYKDFEIQDLQLNALDFMQDASYWQLTGLVTNQTSMICNNTYLLGGYGILEDIASLKRVYDTPQAHSSVFITFDLWMMNSWTNTNSMSIIVSNGVTTFVNQSIFQATFTGEYDWNTVNLQCNETSNVQIVPVRIQTQHTGDKLYFIISSSTGNNQYFGLRNLKITISTQYHYLSSCIAINGGNPSDFSDTCPCTSGYYKSSTTTTSPSCALCDPSCSQCKGPAQNQCSVCNSNYAYNGLQCIECDSSCTTCSGPGQNQCVSCPSDQYLYPSGKCLSYCTAPFTSQVRNGITYCDFPCSQDLFLYQNNSCLEECPSPFTTRIAESAQYCECDSLNAYSVCLSDSDVSFVQAMNTLRTTTQAAAGLALAVSSLVSFGDPAVLIVSSISRMLQCTKYFNISYSTRLQVILDNFNTSILDINTGISTPYISYILQDKTGYQSLPSVFSRYDVQASFIVSYWDGFVRVLILIGSVIFTFILEQLAYRTTKDKAIYPVARIVRFTVQNFAVIYLYREFGKIVFASLINLIAADSTAIWTSTGGILSNIIDGTLLLAGIVMFSMNIRVIYMYQRNKQEKDVKTANSETNDNFLKKYEGVQVLFRDFQNFSWAHQSILLFYIIREVLFYLLLTHFSEYPLIQVMWILLINITMIIHLNINRPFKKHSEALKQNCFEILLLTVNTLLVLLATLDKFDVERLITKEILCFFVLAIIFGFNFAVLGPLVVQGFIILKNLYKSWRHKRANMPVIKVWPTDIQPRQIKKKCHREKQSFDALGSDSEITFRQKDKTYSSPIIISPGESQPLEEIYSIDFSSLLSVKKAVVHSHQKLERKCSIFKGGTRENL